MHKYVVSGTLKFTHHEHQKTIPALSPIFSLNLGNIIIREELSLIYVDHCIRRTKIPSRNIGFTYDLALYISVAYTVSIRT